MSTAPMDRLHSVLPVGLFHNHARVGRDPMRYPWGVAFLAVEPVPDTCVRSGDIVFRTQEVRCFVPFLRCRWRQMPRREFPALEAGLDALEHVDDSWRCHEDHIRRLKRYLTHRSALTGSNATSKIIVARPVEPSTVSEPIRAEDAQEAVLRLLDSL